MRRELKVVRVPHGVDPEWYSSVAQLESF